MKYGLKRPCSSCPFVIDNDFRLMPDRIREIADAQSFTCHSTVDYDAYDEEAGEYHGGERDQHCFGHLVVSWAEYGGFQQVTALAAQLGMFDPHSLPTPQEAGCFESFEDYAEREKNRHSATAVSGSKRGE